MIFAILFTIFIGAIIGGLTLAIFGGKDSGGFFNVWLPNFWGCLIFIVNLVLLFGTLMFYIGINLRW